MSILETLITVAVLVCCAGGIVWLFNDINKQAELMKAEEESTLGLVEDDEE